MTPGWEGEVRVMNGEYEGPQSYDPHNSEALYKYSMDVVSTGEFEYGNHGHEDGIVDSGGN